MKLTRSLLLLLPLSAGLSMLTACDGGAEEAGETLDEAADDAGDAVEEAADDVEDAVDGH